MNAVERVFEIIEANGMHLDGGRVLLADRGQSTDLSAILRAEAANPTSTDPDVGRGWLFGDGVEWVDAK